MSDEIYASVYGVTNSEDDECESYFIDAVAIDEGNEWKASALAIMAGKADKFKEFLIEDCLGNVFFQGEFTRNIKF